MTDVIPANCKPASSYTSLSLHDPVKIRIRDDDGENQPITLPQLFKGIAEKCGDRPALVSQEANGEWITLNFQEYWEKSRLIARGLIKLGLEPRTSCGIIALTCPEWFFTHMGAIFGGGVSAGIYSTNSAEAAHYILESSIATVCVVDDRVQMAKVKAIKHRLPKLKSVIQIHGPYEDFVDTEEGYYSWAKLEEFGASDGQLELQMEERLKDVVANECCTLIYTSGTVGMPKGVMISHDNLITAASTMVKFMPNVQFGHEVIVSYLPLSHIAGQLFDLLISMLMGACTYFADKNALKGTLIKTIIKARPTYFFGVPRIFEKMQEKLMAAEREMPWLSKLILSTARTSVEGYHLAVMENDNTLMCSLKHCLGSMVTQKLKTALGFNVCKSFFTGAAPISVETKKFFLGYDMVFSEIYGLSEACGPVSVAWAMETLTTCGRTLSGVELKLENVDEKGCGEICIRCRFIFMGYLNDPEKTTEALTDDGWLRTGDIGYTDSAGLLYITGRFKELIVTSGGENIPPVHIEQHVLHALPGLSNAMLIGDKRKFLTILVTIKTEMEQDRPTDNLNAESLEWIKSLELPYTTLKEIRNAGPCPKVLQSIQKGIDRANANAISNAHRVQKFAILPHDFSIPTGELGPTLKLRRNIVLEKYADIIESLYQ